HETIVIGANLTIKLKNQEPNVY
ncbi:MAG: hypothetical protein RL679_1703, partial [Bacteroidota bacterium]